jgi:hypothetical protein
MQVLWLNTSIGTLYLWEIFLEKKLARNPTLAEPSLNVSNIIDTVSLNKNDLMLYIVDDNIVIELVKKQIVQLEKDNKSWIIEGFPRTKVQALSL